MNDQSIIQKALQEVKQSDTFKNLIKKYQADTEEIDLIPICFTDDLPVSARTAHGIISLNSKLKEKPETIPGYLMHELTHVLQQCWGNSATQGSDKDNYLDNEYEIDGFQEQNAFISETKGKPAAEEYTSKLLNHHNFHGKERKDKKEELLQLASSKILPKQLTLDLSVPTLKETPKLLKTQIQLMKDYDQAVEEGPKEEHRKILLEKLHPLDQKKECGDYKSY